MKVGGEIRLRVILNLDGDRSRTVVNFSGNLPRIGNCESVFSACIVELWNIEERIDTNWSCVFYCKITSIEQETKVTVVSEDKKENGSSRRWIAAVSS